MAENALGITEIENQEHISTQKTGDNIAAKRVANYGWDGSNWQRISNAGGKLVSIAYDYIAATYPSGTQEVYAFYTGGSSGILVATVTVNYTDSTKVNISNVART